MAHRQEIIIELYSVHCDKCRSKAMQIAATADGSVNSVKIQGMDRDQLAVVGVGIDSTSLTQSLRKKFRHANILSVRPITSSPGRSSWSSQYESYDHYNTFPSMGYQQHHQCPAPSYYSSCPRVYTEAYDSSASNCIVM
ncbi:disease resistance protein RGA5-like [Punica granatum]|uniref:Uncharacterized protein n=2 Tax=Punica granatum TaxID=22663 RepID=A0A2I0LDQ7_PUNGR|nr:disease resistance protein RGA5-like [Punica granatum]PKI78814.1 hypothetical protein CRG98_000774 [Punica granatum]